MSIGRCFLFTLTLCRQGPNGHLFLGTYENAKRSKTTKNNDNYENLEAYIHRMAIINTALITIFGFSGFTSIWFNSLITHWVLNNWSDSK